MALQSEIYSGTAIQGNRYFPSTKHIASKKHMMVMLKDFSDNWTELSSSKYQLINNTAVLDDDIDITLYEQVEVRVADDEDELVGAISSIDKLLSIKNDITIVANYIDDIKTIAKIAPDLENHLNKIDHHLESVENSLAQAHQDAQTAMDASALVIKTAKTIEDDLKNGQHLVVTLNAIKHEGEVARDVTLVAKDNAKLSETASKTSEVEALKSEQNAKVSETDAGSFAVEAHHWANFAVGQDVPEGSNGAKSSMHWAFKAKDYAVPATTQDIETGTDNVKEITSLGLKHGFRFYLNSNLGVASGNVPVIDASGKLPLSIMPHGRDLFRGSFTPTTATPYPTGTVEAGDYYVADGLTSDFTFTTGSLNGKKVSNRDEMVSDGTTWYLIGKPDFDGSIYVKKDHFANATQVQAGTSTDTIISPKVLHDTKESLVMDIINHHSTTTGEPNKLARLDANGKLTDGTLGHGIGATTTLKATDAPLSVGTIRSWDTYGVYCLPTVDVSGKLMSDTQSFFGIPNTYTEMAVIPQRDKNIFTMFGLDGNTTVMFIMVIPALALDTLVLTDATAPKFKIIELIHQADINAKLALKLDKTATAKDSAKLNNEDGSTFMRRVNNDINLIRTISKHDYDALATKDAHTIYIIK